MKGLFKFIFVLILFLVVTIGVPLGILYFTIVDNTDDAPTSLYAADVTLEAQLTQLLDRAFDLEDKNYIDITFTEDEINKMIFAVVRDSMNDQYLPSDTCTTDACRYIKTNEFEVPVLGAVKVHIKSIYATVDDGILGLYVTMESMGFNTRAKLEASFDETEDAFIIKFETLGLGKGNLLSGYVSTAMFWALEQAQVTKTVINDIFADKGLPFSIDLEKFSILIDKDKVNELLEKIISPDDMEESNEKDMLAELVLSLTSKENGLVKFGVFENSFGLRFDLEKFQVDPDLIVLNDNIKIFDETVFIQNKVQGFVISNLVPTAQSKIVFTNLEFNQILYSQSNGYEQFVVEVPIPNANTTIRFEVLGILLNFNPTDVEIRININLNGLDTSIKMVGDVQFNDSSSVAIVIREQITIGEDIDAETGDYVIANASFILGMLSDNMSSVGILEYAASLNAFILSAEAFTQLMEVSGGSATPLTISRIKIVNNAVYFYASIDVSDPLFGVLNDATDAIAGVLANNTLTTGDFNTTDPDEAAIIDAFLTTLDDVADGLTNGTLTEETTTEFIELLNQMSDENRDAFLTNLETSADSTELLDLYDSLFGR